MPKSSKQASENLALALFIGFPAILVIVGLVLFSIARDSAALGTAQVETHAMVAESPQ